MCLLLKQTMSSAFGCLPVMNIGFFQSSLLVMISFLYILFSSQFRRQTFLYLFERLVCINVFSAVQPTGVQFSMGLFQCIVLVPSMIILLLFANLRTDYRQNSRFRLDVYYYLFYNSDYTHKEKNQFVQHWIRQRWSLGHGWS